MSRFTQFSKDVNNQSIECSSRANIYQCMDLAYFWVIALGIPKATIAQLYAKDVFLKATDLTRQYFEIIPNGPTNKPNTGDLVVFDGRVQPQSFKIKAGHICIATGEGDSMYFRSLDQNWGGVSLAVYHKHNYYGVVGWLRPR
jgi:hypothetical protein